MSIQSNFPAIKPTLLLDFANVKALDPRVTFSRASTATYYGTQTAKDEENLLLQSQAFDTAAWSKFQSTVTADATTAPDGTTTADALNQGAAFTTSGDMGQGTTVSSGLAYTVSIFAKPNGKNFLRFVETVSTGSFAVSFINVSTGVIGTTAAGHTVSVSAVANGFYRCVISFVANATRSGAVFFSLADTDNSATVTNSGGLFLWGAQLEQRSTATAYTATTTQPITNYIPQLLTAASGVARFDHNPITDESLGLLIEEQRTNLQTYSEQFDDAVWTKSNATITANTIVAPNGTLTGDMLVENTATGTHIVVASQTFTASSQTYSVFAKAAGRSFLRLVIFDGTNAFAAYFNLLTGLVGTVTGTTVASISAAGNGWYRCAISATTLAAAGNVACRLASADAVDSYTGNGYSGVFLWGAQLEAGAFPTSYIQTVSSQVTRAADAASMTGANFSSWYNQAEGTVYCESATSSFSANMGAWAIGNPSLAFGSGNMMYEVYTASSGQRAVNGFSNGSAQFIVGPTVAQTVNTFTRGAFGYAINNFASIVSASAASSDTSGTVPQGVTGLSIGGLQQGWSGGSNPLNGTIRKIAFYPIRCTNTQLQGLTS